ncbi:MAG TPA: radical SAM protein [Gemmatimonadaceae bacterium]|nr:radical SAM protein [Gemmatimonadaceae bacterium]
MDIEEKIDLLMALAADDREGMPGRDATLPPRLRNATRAGALRPLNIRYVRPGATGPKRALLRILMTNACSFNCHYCPMRRDRELPRTLLKPQEMVRIFLDAHRRGWCTGLFITTGIPGRPVKVMDDLIEVLELLRVTHQYSGYIHVKIVPGADDAQIERITALATRVSVNLETPCGETLSAIAPEKKFEQTLVTLQRVQTRVVQAQREERAGRPRNPLLPGGVAGMTTQFVVGVTDDSDRTIMTRASSLYASGGMHHAHFSAFRPIRDTPLEQRAAAPALREHRLYQADHLVRTYGFAHAEIVFDQRDHLPLAYDPKVAWALAHREQFPVDIRTASRGTLMRVPGIGPIVADRIVQSRRSTPPRNVADLRKLGAIVSRAAGFLTIAGRRLVPDRWIEQLSLWSPDDDVGAAPRIYEFSPGTFR